MLLIKKAFVLGVLSIFSAAIINPIFTQVKFSDSLTFDPSIKVGYLSNGLKYYIKKNSTPVQKAELRLVIKTGSVNEDEDQLGLAHMTEHMAFNGTKKFKRNDIISYLESIGVSFGNDLNAYTTFDETVYILPIPTDKSANIEKGIQVLNEWAHNVTMKDADIDNERNIIIEESRMGLGADDRIARKLFPKLFSDSRYAYRIPIGKDSIIKHFPYDAIRRYYRDWYRPNLMAVVVVGDVDVSATETLIKKYFAPLKNPVSERPVVNVNIPPYKNKEALVVTDKEATDFNISLMYSVTPKKVEHLVNDYKNTLIKQLFTSIINQRFYEITQQPNAPYLYAGVSLAGVNKNYEQFSVSIYPGTNDASKALESAIKELERVKKFGITKSEIDLQKRNTAAFFEKIYNERKSSLSSDLAEEYIRNFLVNEPVPGIEKEYAYVKLILDSLTPKDFADLVSYMDANDNNYLITLTGPGTGDDMDLPSESELLTVAKNAMNADNVTAYEDVAISTTLLEKLPKPGTIVKETKDVILKTKSWYLSNNTKVTFKITDFKDDQILMAARRQGGYNNYDLKDKYSAELSTTIANLMGFGNFDAVTLNKALAGKSANVTASMSSTVDGFYGNSNIKDLETLFQLLYLKSTAPRADSVQFVNYIDKRKQQAYYQFSNPETVFIDSLLKLKNMNNPYAGSIVETAEDLSEVQLKRAVEIYKERFSDVSGMEFVFVGSINEDTLKLFVEKYIASLPTSGKTFGWKDVGVRSAKGIHNIEINKGQEDKSLICQIYSGEMPYSEDMELKAQIITTILNKKINEELREKIQGIYSGSISGGLTKLPYNNFYFIVQLPCGPDKVDVLIAAMKKEIDELIQKGPGKKDLEAAKAELSHQHPISLRSNRYWLEQIMENIFPGNDMEFNLNYEYYLKNINAKSISAAAKLFFDNGNIITGVLNPEVKK